MIRVGNLERSLEFYTKVLGMRELRRKEKALAEAAALLVLSKKVEAIFNKNRSEDE